LHDAETSCDLRANQNGDAVKKTDREDLIFIQKTLAHARLLRMHSILPSQSPYGQAGYKGPAARLLENSPNRDRLERKRDAHQDC